MVPMRRRLAIALGFFAAGILRQAGPRAADMTGASPQRPANEQVFQVFVYAAHRRA
jgi:hypothetical protein